MMHVRSNLAAIWRSSDVILNSIYVIPRSCSNSKVIFPKNIGQRHPKLVIVTVEWIQVMCFSLFIWLVYTSENYLASRLIEPLFWVGRPTIKSEAQKTILKHPSKTLRGHPGVQMHYRATWMILTIKMSQTGLSQPSVTIGIQQPSHNMLRGQWGYYQIRQELAIQTPGCPLNLFAAEQWARRYLRDSFWL